MLNKWKCFIHVHQKGKIGMCASTEDLSYYEVPKSVKFRPDWFGDKHGNSYSGLIQHQTHLEKLLSQKYNWRVTGVLRLQHRQHQSMKWLNKEVIHNYNHNLISSWMTWVVFHNSTAKLAPSLSWWCAACRMKPFHFWCTNFGIRNGRLRHYQ